MNKNLTWTLALLALLTLVAVLVTHVALAPATKKPLLLALFSAKFLLVAFQFMELKKAHVAWRAAIVVFLVMVNLVVAVA